MGDVMRTPRAFDGGAKISLGLVAVMLGALAAKADAPLPSLDEMVAGLERFGVSGKVVDKDGEPVKKAEVFCYYMKGRDGVRDRFVGKTKTNRKGEFEFKSELYWEPTVGDDDEGTGKYAFIAKHPGHGINFRILMEGDDSDGITIPMREPSICKVIVENPEGERLEGVHAFLCGGQLTEEEQKAEDVDRAHRHLRMHEDIGLSSGMTDKTGRVKLMAPENWATFWAEKEGCVRGWRPGSRDGKDIVLFPSARISGKATLGEGTPAANMAVYYTYHGNRLFYSETVMTDENGDYVLENIPGAEFRLSWQDPEEEKGAPGTADLKVVDLRPDSPYMAKKESFEVKPGDDLTKDLVLTGGLLVGGVVRDLTTNEPVPKMNLNLYSTIPGQRYLDTQNLKTDGEGRWSATVAPDNEIHFQWEDSRDGDYIIDEDWKRQNNYQPFRGTLSEDKTDFEFKVKLWPVGELAGKVLDADGKGVKGASVYITSRINGVKTDESGAFTLKVAPKDRDFDLLAVSEEKDLAGLVHLVGGATAADIRLEPTRSYEGQAVSTDGVPASDLKFYMDLRLNETNLYRVREEPHTDDEGKFSVENLCPKATYYAWWSADDDDNRDYSYGNATIDLTKLEPGAPITFEAVRFLNALMGTVVDERGEPVAGAKVTVASSNMVPQDARQQENISDDAGEFTVERLAPGTVSLRVVAEGYKTRMVSAPSDSFDLKVPLGPVSEGSIYRVSVVDEEGKPVADAPVSLQLTLHKESGPVEEKQERRTDKEGKAEFTFKPEGEKVSGRGNIGCDLPGHDLAFAGVELNQDVDVTLAVRKSGEHWAGTLLSSTDEPIADAEVRVIMLRQAGNEDYWSYGRFGDDSEYVFRTKADGTFELPRFGKQDHVSVKFFADGYATGMNVWFQPDEDKEYVFRLEPGARITGEVIVEGFTGDLPETHVSAADRGTHQYGSGKADAQGRFAIDGLKPGDYQVVAGFQDPEFKKYVCPSRPTVEVKAGETATVTVKFVEGIPVRGTMTDPKTGAAPEGRKGVVALLGEEHVSGAQVNDDGTWEMYLYQGTFQLKYYIEGKQGYQDFESITVEAGKPVEGIAIEVSPPDGAKSEE
jgi:uncharacterized GH25 family protein